MTAANKNLPLRDQIFNQKVKIWDLYCKSRVAETLEKTNEQTFREIYDTYIRSFTLWGGVEFVFWLQALVKKCRQYNAEIEPIYIFNLRQKNAGDREKITNLKVIAKQMGLDVTITNNRTPKPPSARNSSAA